MRGVLPRWPWHLDGFWPMCRGRRPGRGAGRRGSGIRRGPQAAGHRGAVRGSRRAVGPASEGRGSYATAPQRRVSRVNPDRLRRVIQVALSPSAARARSRRSRPGAVRPGAPKVRPWCGSLLAALDVHPRVAMQILRHSKISITMEIYAIVPDKTTLAALKRLGDTLGSPDATLPDDGRNQTLLYAAAVHGGHLFENAWS